MQRFCVALFSILLTVVTVWAGTAKDITSAEAKGIIAKNRNTFILDVRTQQERNQGFIPGSVLIPIDVIERRINEVPKNRPVVVYCAVGSRSRVVAQALSASGYRE